MTYISRDFISAALLREIALSAAHAMKKPENWTINSLSTDRRGNFVSVYSDDAVVLSIDGHVMKAAQQCLGFKGMSSISDRDDRRTSKIVAVLNQIDAQIRFVDQELRGPDAPFRSMITQSYEPAGRENLTSLLERVAARLEKGDDQLLSPYDVGIMRDLPKEKPDAEAVDEDEVVGC